MEECDTKKVVALISILILSFLVVPLVSSSRNKEKSKPLFSPLGNDFVNDSDAVFDRQSFWAGNTWNNPLPNYDGSMLASFTGVVNTVGGLQSGDWIGILPINLAYGSSHDTFTWIQFVILFKYGGGVDFVLEENLFANSQMDYGTLLNGREWSTSPGIAIFQRIGVGYVVGHYFVCTLFVSDTTHVEFFLEDESTHAVWDVVISVPSTNVLYMDWAFSPAATVEGYVSTSVSAITGFPYLDLDIMNYMRTSLDNSFLNGIAGADYYTIDTSSEGYWRWCSISDSELIPSPSIQHISYPLAITLGESAIIDIPVLNTGGTANWMNIAISFPTNPSVTALAIDYSGTSSELNPIIFGAGANMTCDYLFRFGGANSRKISASYPSVEGTAWGWSGNTLKRLIVKVTPTVLGDFRFMVKSLAAFQYRPLRWDATLHTVAAAIDQQGEYAYNYTISVKPFQDGFESGNFIAWTGTTLTLGETASATNTQAHHGVYSGSFTSDGGGGNEAACIYKTITPSTELYSRGYFYVAKSGITKRARATSSETCYVTIKIYTSTGVLKRTLSEGALQTSGSKSIVWNGRDNSNNIVPAGTYTVKMYVADKAGNKATSYPIIKTVTVL